MPKKRKNKRTINVQERKLGKEGAMGLAHYDFFGKNLNLIEIINLIENHHHHQEIHVVKDVGFWGIVVCVNIIIILRF